VRGRKASSYRVSGASFLLSVATCSSKSLMQALPLLHPIAEDSCDLHLAVAVELRRVALRHPRDRSPSWEGSVSRLAFPFLVAWGRVKRWPRLRNASRWGSRASARVLGRLWWQGRAIGRRLRRRAYLKELMRFSRTA
jgi:hypothetical protein